MSTNLRRLLVDYFKDVANELKEHLVLGYGAYPSWTTLIKPPLTNLRQTGETYAVHLWLQQNKTTPQMLTAPEPPQMNSQVIVAPNGQMLYSPPEPLFYNQATQQAGTMPTLDPRYRSYSDPYSGQHTTDDRL
jgi:hypothetical protein